ncbi:hypothetical protein KDK77_10815, partial [bacterium]|nr:hypothetical protein [bacterium]
MIHLTGDGVMYCRGDPITIEDMPCVQVEFLGTTDGHLASNEEKRYQVAIYQFENNELTVKKLNTDIIDANLKDTALLKQEFL